MANNPDAAPSDRMMMVVHILEIEKRWGSENDQSGWVVPCFIYIHCKEPNSTHEVILMSQVGPVHLGDDHRFLGKADHGSMHWCVMICTEFLLPVGNDSQSGLNLPGKEDDNFDKRRPFQLPEPRLH